MSSSPAWRNMKDHIEGLAECFVKYSEYLTTMLQTTLTNQSKDEPVRTIGQDGTIQFRKKYPVNLFGEKYSLIDKAVRSQEYVVFDEEVHLHAPFKSNQDRYRYFKQLQLTVNVYIIRFCPGGSLSATTCLAKKESANDVQMMIEGVRLLDKVSKEMTECHTRAQRRLVRDKIANIAKVPPAVAEFLYRELLTDGSQANNSVMQQRLSLIYHGETDLIPDLRALGSGRPTVFDPFFENLAEVVGSITAADDRRHGVAHLARWINIQEMISEAANMCPVDTPIPSAALVRLQFAPRNAYTHRALSFTSRIQVQHPEFS